ncbi:protein Niban 3 [Microcaecilia unicolor]|uniref:Niban-like protein 2 n=1 Tax=Microcaecilia unicolor TaxID=1415580 RepID=A0A6P7XD43_9AMPH|nr:niban-like protein 2 [Microcaecilia unicolor]
MVRLGKTPTKAVGLVWACPWEQWSSPNVKQVQEGETELALDKADFRWKMGGVCSSRLDDRQRRYLQGRTDAVLRSFMPYYRRQVASVFFRQVQGELEPPGKHGLQLLQYKVCKDPDSTLHEGFLLQYNDKSQKWRESYVTVRGDFTLEWFRYREVQGKDCKPQGRAVLTGYQLAVSLRDYVCLVESFCQQLLGAPLHQVKDALRCPPTEFSLFLFHPHRQHLCFCLTSAESLCSLRAILRDGIRWYNTAQQRGDHVTAEAFVEAVRFYRQEKGSYGASDHLLGNNAEILSNMVMQDLRPWLQSQVLQMRKRTMKKKKVSCFSFLQGVYTLILDQVSAEFQASREEEVELLRQLEKKIRPELDQMLTLKAQISGKMQTVVSSGAQSLCENKVEPALDYVIEELLGPISSGFEMVLSLFAQRINRIIDHAQSHLAAVPQEVFNLTEMPRNSVLMQQCYEKATLFLEGLQGLGDRFGFQSVAGLMLRAQNLMQELMQNLVFTFQHLSNLHLNRISNTPEVIQTLEKVRGRVFKKFDYDSSAIRKQFTQDALIQIFLPFLLQHLESSCKLELPKYKTYVFADYSSIISMESVYEEIVLGLLQKAIDKGLKEASNQSKHNLYSDSFTSIFSSVEDCRTEPDGNLSRPGQCLNTRERKWKGHGVQERSRSVGNPGASGDAQRRDYGNTLKGNQVFASSGGLRDLEASCQTGPYLADGEGTALSGNREPRGQSALAVTMPNEELTPSATHSLQKSAWPTFENLNCLREADGVSLLAVEMEMAHRQLLLDGLSLAMEMAVFQMDRDLLEMDKTEQRGGYS